MPDGGVPGMTWLKLSDDYGDDLARFNLSDAAFRTHTEALGWVMRRENGGCLTERDVLRFAETEFPSVAVQELCDLGLWEKTPDGYMVRHHMEHQPEPAVLAARRVADATRQQRLRNKRAGLTEVADQVDQSHGVTHGVAQRVTRVGSGRVGTGNPTPLVRNQQSASGGAA